jgi:hypothetical protein
MARNKNKNSDRLKSLLAQSNRCRYCHVKVHPSKDGTGVQDDTVATVDHIYSRYSLIRMLFANKYGKTRQHKDIVLSCYKCNKERNDNEQRKAAEFYKSLPGDEDISLIDLISNK